VIGIPGRDAQCALLAAAADKQRQPVLNRGGLVRCILQLEVAARKVVRGWQSRQRKIWTASSNRSIRSLTVPSAMPYAACSFSCQPAPTPSVSRPWLTWSTAAAILARTAGCR
jgi:hypothetical protein